MGKGRAPCCDKNQVKRGPWSPAEDLRLITFIHKHGHENWRSLPKQAGLLRCGKSCRLRWINYLRPDVKRGNFTQEEEDSIIRLHRELGNKWSKIASHLPGRTDNEIKNVWNTHLKKRVSSSGKKTGELTKGSLSTSSSSSSSFSTTTTLSVKMNMEATIGMDEVQRKREGVVDVMEEDEEEEEEVVNKEEIRHSENEMTANYEIESSPKEISASSVGSSILTNSGLMDNVVSMDSIFSLGESAGNFYDVLEDQVSHPGIEDFSLEIPLESDMEFWNLLDGLAEPSGNEGENVASLSGDPGAQLVDEGEDDKQKWLRYLETELGLEDTNNGAKIKDEGVAISPVPEELTEQFFYDDESLRSHDNNSQIQGNPISPNRAAY